MAEMLLINPRSRRRKARRNPARSAAQRAATRRLVAMNRSRSNPSRRKARRRNPTAPATACTSFSTDGTCRKLTEFMRSKIPQMPDRATPR